MLLEFYTNQRERLIEQWGKASPEERGALLKQIFQLEDKIDSIKGEQ